MWVMTRTHVRGYHLPSLRDWRIAWALRSSDSRPRLSPVVAPRLADCVGVSFLGLTSEAITCRRSATGGLRGRFVPRTHVRGYHLSSLRDWRIAWALRSSDSRPRLSPVVAPRLADSHGRFVPRTDVRGYHLPSLRDWRIAWALSFLGLTSEAITCRRSATGGSFRNREAMSCASLGRESQVSMNPNLARVAERRQERSRQHVTFRLHRPPPSV